MTRIIPSVLLVSVTMALCLVDGGALVAPILLYSKGLVMQTERLDHIP